MFKANGKSYDLPFVYQSKIRKHSMLFNSINFLLFFPVVLFLYYIVPVKIKYIWLLVASYYFYMCWNAKYALLLLFCTVVTYFTGISIEKIKKNNKLNKDNRTKLKKLCIAVAFILNFSVLVFFKYFEFLMDNINRIFNLINIELNLPSFDIILPIGISFYMFQALGYTIDVYRDEIETEKNFLKYALFVGFFPRLIAGPIERSKNLLKQLSTPQKCNWDMARQGFLLMLWGYFLKIVLADRIAIFVNCVYGDYNKFNGTYIIVATLLFAVQIYGDFYGYSIIAVGASMMLGIRLMKNFDSPYLAKSVAEFWRRWHISLSTWFRDYLYIPLGGNRKGKVRKYVNLLVVFIASGLWHGSQWTFVVWGALNGLYQILGDILKPVRKKIVSLLKTNTESFSHKALQIVSTFLLIDFAWLFFRAPSINDAFLMIKSMFMDFNVWILFDDSLYNCGLDSKNFILMLIAIIILIIADTFKYKDVIISKEILKQDYWFRCLFISASIALILLFGIWGSGYDSSSFIYTQF